MKRWQWALRLITRRMWFRAALFCAFAVALALAGALIGHAISYDFAAKVGSKSVDNILNVLASSMLAVTTFSLTAMVQAYSGATSNITPRAVQLLIDDPTAQNALATFLGSFLFAIAGIIALSTGLYGETGRVILYGGTIAVIVFIVVTFLRWIEHVASFGRVGDTIDRVERAASKAVGSMAQPLRLDGGDETVPPDGAAIIRHGEIGRVTHIDLEALSTLAAEVGGEIAVLALPGTLVDPARALARCGAALDDEQECRVRAAFTLAHTRAFDHDPRFGLVVLGEIADRALSPAVNDPGTAIAVIEAATRVLAAALTHRPDAACASPPGVVVPRYTLAAMLDDVFRPIARDGAAMVEVGIRLQKALAALAAIDPAATRDCRARAVDARDRATSACGAADGSALATLFDSLWQTGTAEARPR